MSDDQAGHGSGHGSGHDAAAAAAEELARSDQAWAAQADRFPAAQVGASPAGATQGPAAHAPAGGGASPSSDGPRRGPRPVRGPSGNAMMWLRGLGLLSVLAVVAIMALLSWRILSDTGGDDVQVVRGDPASTVPAGDAAGDAQLGTGSTDAADAAACEVDRRTVETAALAYEMETGARPPDVQALVDIGFLKPGLDLQVAIAPDGTVVSTGTCAGG